ncbi:mucoidy inhibitor A, putative, partial [Rhizoctonia solani AG-3 Rhs1AP]
MVSEQPAANRITVNAAEQDDSIEAATVFQSNRAEIKRRVNLDLKKGQNHVHIERLPSCLNGDSIRVDGTGTAVIFDVVYHAPSYSSSSSDDESVTTARRTLETLQKERDVAREQSQFLASYGKTLDSKNVNIEDIGKASKELDEARSKAYQDKQGEKRGTRVTVTVLAETDGKAELMLTYVVSNASWTPLYDIRAAIAKSPDATSKMMLHYRASITQTTGENWPEVALTLSTASPQLGSQVPTLSPWKIGFPAPPPLPPWRDSAPIPQSRFLAHASVDESEESDDDMGFGFDGDNTYTAPQMASRKAHVATAGVLSATFGIPGRSDIPSEEGSHKVVVAVLDLEAELEWICVPREKESVFLTCNVINSSEFTLLPGEASVFMDDNFVSKSRIEHVSPNDSFKTSLGVDSSLRVTYPSAKTLNRTATQSSFAFLARERQSISAQSQRTTIRNSRLTSVSDLRVVDHLPVSTDARLKVNVISPSGLNIQQAPGSPTSPGSGDKNKDKSYHGRRAERCESTMGASGCGRDAWMVKLVSYGGSNYGVSDAKADCSHARAVGPPLTTLPDVPVYSLSTYYTCPTIPRSSTALCPADHGAIGSALKMTPKEVENATESRSQTQGTIGPGRYMGAPSSLNLPTTSIQPFRLSNTTRLTETPHHDLGMGLDIPGDYEPREKETQQIAVDESTAVPGPIHSTCSTMTIQPSKTDGRQFTINN